ncbi:hypothetical protein HN789_05320 [archaeon]|jgi:hypothetical protein|nr:hypothetical protein [archaeon]MBT4271923.1 hypothetical protein [archaeon]MBT4461761.1 hypothetical protein [archaeon]MBT4858711.1 hypothetical protein [archaeon]MBT6773565.1 hypothetical protein [archaeon]
MNNLESTFFYAIILTFSIGLLMIEPAHTGFVVGESQVEVIQIQEFFNSTSRLTYTAKGEITSIRISGEFTGNGTGRVIFNDLNLIKIQDLENKNQNLLTGLVIDNTSTENNNETIVNIPLENNESFIEEKISNETFENNNESIQEIIEQINSTTFEDNSSEILSEINESFGEEIIEEEIDINIEINETIIQENTTIESNITEQNESNDSNTNTSVDSETSNENSFVKTFNNYCKDTCIVNSGNDITLTILLDDTELFIKSISYTYTNISENSEEIQIPIIPVLTNETNVSIELNTTINNTNISINMSLGNLTNITILNQTISNLTNISDLNNSILNISINETLKFNETLVNETNVTEQIIPINIMLTDLQRFNNSLVGFKLIDSFDNTVVLNYSNNIIRLLSNNLSKSSIKAIETNDNRLSNFVFLINNTQAVQFELNIDEDDVVLKCTQQENESCKRWQRTSTAITTLSGKKNFVVYDDGIYALSEEKTKTPKFIPTKAVYYNNDCDSCVTYSECNAKDFCAIQNRLNRNFNFVGQFDFDIYYLEDSSIKSVEICAYNNYLSNNKQTNFIRNSDYSYCNDIRIHSTESLLISTGIINNPNDWNCVDVTSIVNYNINEGYSNIFLDWIGDDAKGSNGDITCFSGEDNLENCGGENPSGAKDCRPYLKIDYK